jgi:hypothetical protein
MASRRTRAQHFPSNLYPYPNHNHQQRPMSTHAHPCPPMVFKLRPCIQKLCNVCYPPTQSLGWIGQIKDHSLSLASARSASWLANSLHPRSLTSIWSWMHGCTKPMPTHAHPCPLMNNNIAPMPTQNPWVWVSMGMGMSNQCRALRRTKRKGKERVSLSAWVGATSGEDRQLVTGELVEFEKYPVEVHQNCRKITNGFRGVYRRIYPNLIKGNRRMSTCNWLDLQTRGSQPIIYAQKSP